MGKPTYHDQEDVIGFCADYRHPWGCQDDVSPWGDRVQAKAEALDNFSADELRLRLARIHVLMDGVGLDDFPSEREFSSFVNDIQTIIDGDSGQL